MFGYDSAFIGGALTLPSFQKRFGLESAHGTKLANLKANIVSTFQAGAFFGAILVYPVTEKFGRRLTLLLCGLLFNLGAIAQLASSGHVGAIYAGRVLTGLAVGASSLIIPVYISESSPPAIRGRLVGLFECFLQVSQVIGFWMNYGVSLHVPKTLDKQWQIPFSFQVVPASLLVILMFFQPESPRWLVKAGKADQARRNLSRLRQLPLDHEYISWEINTAQRQIEAENSLGANRSVWAKVQQAFTLPGNRQRLLIGMALMLLQNMSGINALNYYSPAIFAAIGFSGTDVSLLATGVFGLVKASTTLILMLFLIDRLGRRRAMLIGSCGGIVAMYYLGGYTAQSHSFTSEHVPKDGGAYIAILMVYLFAFFYALSWNGVPWVFCSEVFPTAIRSVCLVFTTCSQWLAQFIIVYSTPYMMTNITYGTFLLFGTSLVVGIVFIYLFFPETKGLLLEEMDILFSQRGPATAKRRETDRIIQDRRNDGHAQAVVAEKRDEKTDPMIHVEAV